MVSDVWEHRKRTWTESFVEVFLVPMSLDKKNVCGKPISLDDFLEANPFLKEKIYPIPVTQDELDILNDLMGDAIENGNLNYMYQKQIEKGDAMDKQLMSYRNHLREWADAANSLFGDETITVTRRDKDRNLREIETIVDKESQFLKDLSILDGTDPYIKVLAVYYNN